MIKNDTIEKTVKNENLRAFSEIRKLNADK